MISSHFSRISEVLRTFPHLFEFSVSFHSIVAIRRFFENFNGVPALKEGRLIRQKNEKSQTKYFIFILKDMGPQSANSILLDGFSVYFRCERLIR